METKFAVGVAMFLIISGAGMQSVFAAIQIDRSGSALPLPGDTPYKKCFDLAAARHGVQARLLAAVARVESAYDPMAVSHKDAVGIMQIRWPLTARHLGIERREELFNPCLNIDAGARYLRELIDRFETLEQALAAYNMGPSRIQGGRTVAIPTLGQKYVELVARAHGQLDLKVAAPPGARRPRSTVEFPLKSRERALAVETALKVRNPGIEVSLKETPSGWILRVVR